MAKRGSVAGTGSHPDAACAPEPAGAPHRDLGTAVLTSCLEGNHPGFALERADTPIAAEGTQPEAAVARQGGHRGSRRRTPHCRSRRTACVSTPCAVVGWLTPGDADATSRVAAAPLALPLCGEKSAAVSEPAAPPLCAGARR